MHCRTNTSDYLTPSTTSVSALSKDARAFIPHVNGSFPIMLYTGLLASVHSLMHKVPSKHSREVFMKMR